MHIEFFGAAGEVTGSCHIVHVNGHKLLLDCGMIQGSRENEARNAEPFPFASQDIDAVVLSHAHIDHSGRLPLLAKRGYRGPVYAQNATRDLTRILLADSANLQERDAEYKNKRLARKGADKSKWVSPLYTEADAGKVSKLLKGLPYRQKKEILPGVTIRFRDAGHIMGSCVVEIWLQEGEEKRKLVFSGDLGQYDTPILWDPEPIRNADIVLMESTYGSRRHRDRSETIDEIGEIISKAESGNILIPAFSIGRSQEILFQLGIHYEEWGVDRFQVFLDSPMAIEASEVYWNHDHLFDDEAKEIAKEDGMPPLPNLKLSRKPEDSMAINKIRHGAIVIAGSGMCNGGRIVHHLKHNLGRPETQVIIVGYQARGSMGRRLVEGSEYVRIHGEEVPVKAKIHTVGGLSAHGDQDDLARWYENFKTRPPIYLVHGEEDSVEAFQDYMQQRCRIRPYLTEPGMKVKLT